MPIPTADEIKKRYPQPEPPRDEDWLHMFIEHVGEMIELNAKELAAGNKVVIKFPRVPYPEVKDKWLLHMDTICKTIKEAGYDALPGEIDIFVDIFPRKSYMSDNP